MGTETSGAGATGGAQTFDAAQAAFATAHIAWDPDSCADPITRTVMSDQNGSSHFGVYGGLVIGGFGWLV
ncbi:hypothetical protein [Bifidobacterium vespertilionis]|uniref:hypothetical protein n=1 Tax=Bifidobacterium vespertilionis TaxID=2562524 RepID=UPI001BDBF607|nr:hypothetical protein [Bifidobacterium vespertilionis]MBT1179392.1 hypothetical protein [Bifidobacterium vespertilionis]